MTSATQPRSMKTSHNCATSTTRKLGRVGNSPRANVGNWINGPAVNSRSRFEGKPTMLRRILPLVTVLIPLPATAAEFEFKDGDRVVLIGSTLIEREQRY